jgi:hypothetical protein
MGDISEVFWNLPCIVVTQLRLSGWKKFKLYVWWKHRIVHRSRKYWNEAILDSRVPGSVRCPKIHINPLSPCLLRDVIGHVMMLSHVYLPMLFPCTPLFMMLKMLKKLLFFSPNSLSISAMVAVILLITLNITLGHSCLKWANFAKKLWKKTKHNKVKKLWEKEKHNKSIALTRPS